MRSRNRFGTASHKDIVESRKKLKQINLSVRVQIFIIFEHDEREKNAYGVITNSTNFNCKVTGQLP